MWTNDLSVTQDNYDITKFIPTTTNSTLNEDQQRWELGQIEAWTGNTAAANIDRDQTNVQKYAGVVAEGTD